MCRAPPTLATDAALAEGAARTDAVKKAILNSPVAVTLAKAAEERRAAAEKRAAEQAAAAERAAKAAAEQAAAEKAAAEKAAAEKAAAEKAEREKAAAEKAAAWRAIRAERDPKLTKDVATANDCSKVRTTTSSCEKCIFYISSLNHSQNLTHSQKSYKTQSNIMNPIKSQSNRKKK